LNGLNDLKALGFFLLGHLFFFTVACCLMAVAYLIENRGASIRNHTFREVEKGNKKKFSQERLCLLTCLLMGDSKGISFF